MSTLQLSNIRDTSGNNNSTPEQIIKGRAKAWVHFDGTTGTLNQADVTMQSSFNVTSITDAGDGEYTIDLTNAMANTNYLILATTGIETNRFRGVFERIDFTRTASQFRVTNAGQSASSSGLNSGETDSSRISVAVFGD